MGIVFLFPGQNSQQIGMGKDFYEAYPSAATLFDRADAILGFSLSGMCFNGPEDDLNDTINTQPAVYVCSMAILQVLKEVHPHIQPAFAAGHSLGEITALTAAGVFTFEDGLRLVRERGRLMKEAGEQNPGGMAALLGLDADNTRDICKQATEMVKAPVVLANDNCPGQVVISGDNQALETAMQLAQTAGAKKVVRLNVSIAAHSPLMASASQSFRELLDNTLFHEAQIPVYANATAQPLADTAAIREELNRQLTEPVRWTESMQAMIADGAETFIEIGSGDVLTGLMKRIDRDRQRIALNSVAALEQITKPT